MVLLPGCSRIIAPVDWNDFPFDDAAVLLRILRAKDDEDLKKPNNSEGIA